MIHLSQITKTQGQRILYENANFMVRPQDRIGLVGPNGAGKTTIFRIIVGEDQPDAGQVVVLPRVVVGYFSQDVGDMKGRSALEETMSGAGEVADLAKEIAAMESRLEHSESLTPDELETLMEKYGDAQAQFQNRGGYDLESRAKAVLTGLGIGPEESSRPVESFSGGWKMRIALAKILTLAPDVLLMDEPTNHLDVESIVWLEEWLQNFKGAIVMTSHDRDFMNRSVNRIAEIAQKTITVYSGNYDFYLKERDIRFQQQLASFKRQQEMLAKEEDFIARFAARASHAAQVQSRVKKLEKIERVEEPILAKTIQFTFQEPPRSGNDVIKLEDLSKVWVAEGSQKQNTVFNGVEGVIRRLDKVAVTGVNGAGKSTLLKLIVGQAVPTTGKVTVGSSVSIGYFGQHALDQLRPEATVFETLSQKLPDLSVGTIRNLLGAFLFSGDDIEKPIRVLSGGEKSRVVLAMILASPLNFLVLDEPTNHLDIQSREVLLQALKSFTGTVLIVSHDRFFLREIVTRVFEIGQGGMTVYEGCYDDYYHGLLERRKKLLEKSTPS